MLSNAMPGRVLEKAKEWLRGGIPPARWEALCGAVPAPAAVDGGRVSAASA
jgi:hypothetical protein